MFVKDGERISGETGAGPVFFKIVDAKRRLTRKRQRQHLDALRHWRNRAALLVGRSCGRDKPDPVQRGLLPTLLGNQEVAQMDGIKRTAKDTDSRWHG